MIKNSGNFENLSEFKKEFINKLVKQGYEYRPDIRNENDLKANLREQLEKLNTKAKRKTFKFEDSEWRQFYKENFSGIGNEGIEKRTKLIQSGGILELKRGFGNSSDIELLSRKEFKNNFLQIIEPLEIFEKRRRNDLTILINGIPLIYIEIKRETAVLADVFNNRLEDDDFTSLYGFIQIFIISNTTETKYYSNTNRYDKKKGSFKFTSQWATDKNEPISNLLNFADTFLSPQTLLDILINFCVFDKGSNLKILRPYQIAAIKRILGQIRNSLKEGSHDTNQGGYIWHTTGSGKTLTSFKAAQLAKEIPEVQKVMFVVDRKDLDSQTQNEYKKFLGESEEKAIDHTESTEALKRLLNDDEKRIIITTIQKLRILLTKHSSSLNKKLSEQRVVIIMDECHRTQTLAVHSLINKKFKKRNIFGFTGTPILGTGKKRNETAILFGEVLHSYKIIDAIKDGNVLKFWIDYVGDREGLDKKISNNNPKRMSEIVKYIIQKYETKTNPSTMGEENVIARSRFNSMMAVESISAAMKYYDEFYKQLEEFKKDLKVAIIFSAYTDIHDPEDDDNVLGEEDDLEEDQRKFLYEKAIKRYEEQFKQKIAGFEDYRKSISEGLKTRAIDILIVVNMFLTGFDAPCLNTIWIDKDLKEHNLIQAFSRTNRIFDAIKQQGNIICFRDIKEEVDEAIRKYADGEGIIVSSIEDMKAFEEIESRLVKEFPVNEPIEDPLKEKEFMNLYNQYMDFSHKLSCDENLKDVRKINFEDRQKYRSKFLGVCEKKKNQREELENREDITNSVVEEDIDIPINLELIKSDEISVEYILNLLNNYGTNKNREEIMRNVRTSPKLRKEEGIISEYLDRVEGGDNLSYQEHKMEKKDEWIYKTSEDLDLNKEKTKEFIDEAIQDGTLRLAGKNLAKNMNKKYNLLTQSKEYIKEIEKQKKAYKKIYDVFSNKG